MAEFFFFPTDFCKFAELDVLVIRWDLVERIRPQDLLFKFFLKTS